MSTILPNPDQYKDWKDWAGSLIFKLQTMKLDSVDLQGGAITEDKIGEGAVASFSLADGSVTTVKLGDSSVTTNKLGNSSVTTAKINDASVTVDKIGNDAVTTAKIGDLSVTTAKLGNTSVTTLKIGDYQVTTDQLGNSSVVAAKIAAGAIVAGKIAAGTIVAADIAAATIIASNIAAGAVVASKLLVGAPGGALNSDPGPSDIGAWLQYDAPGSGGATGKSIVTMTSPAGKVGATALKSTGTTGVPANFPLIPLDRAKVYRGHMWWLSDASANGVDYLFILYYSATGVYAGYSHNLVAGTAPSTSWQEASVQFGPGTAYTHPSSAYYMAISVATNYGGSAGNSWAQDIRIEEALPATLIQDGGIITAKLAAGAVTAAKITAGTITAVELAAASIIAGKIAASAIDVDTLFVNSVVTTGKINTAAATIHTAAEDAGPDDCPASWGTVVTASFTSVGSPVEIFCQMAFHNTNVSLADVAELRLKRGSTVIWPASGTDLQTVGSSAYQNRFVLFYDTPGAGSVTYTLESQAGRTDTKTVNAAIVCDEIKR